MSSRKRLTNRILIAAVFFSFTVPATVFSQESSSQTEARSETRQRLPLDYVIGPGDVLSIGVFQHPELSGEIRVSAQGYIRLLFVDEPIKAAGYTEWELADIVREKYRVILRDPQVTVQVKEGRQDVAYILGAVGTAREVPVNSETRLLNLIAAAGGVSQNAGHVAYILRSEVWSASDQDVAEGAPDVKLTSVIETVNIQEMFQGRVELNKRIYPGDIVTIPEADKVFVGGSVNNPDIIALKTRVTLSQAILRAGGLKPEAKNKVTIMRQEPGQPELTELTADLKKIQNDPSQDIVLQANDIVYVPSSSMKTLGLQLLDTTMKQLAITLPFLILRR